MTSQPRSRRAVLKQSGAAAFGLGGVGGWPGGGPPGDGSPDPVTVHVGYVNERTAGAITDLASDTVRDYGFDAVTVTLSPDRIRRLRRRDDVRYVEPVRRVVSHGSSPGSRRTPVDEARSDSGGEDQQGTPGDRSGEPDGRGRGPGDGRGGRDDGDGRDDGGRERDGDDSEGGADPLSTSIDRVDAERVTDRSGEGVDVAVVDSGIADDHDALSHALDGGAAFVHAGLFHFPGWDDDAGHGTHCAGTIAARSSAHGTGLAPDATLHAVKVLNGRGVGTTATVAAGIEYVARQSYDVACLAFGTDESKLLDDAVEHAAGEGVALVAAVGGDGPTVPATNDACLAVGGATPEDEPAPFTPGGGAVDLLAPGVDVYSTAPDGYDSRSGSSMACAHVAGALALLREAGHSAEAARRRLRHSAEDLGLDEATQGAGLLDVAAAFDEASDDD